MREILFRGKSIERETIKDGRRGEWVYGSLIRMDDEGGQTFIFPPYNYASSQTCGQLVAYGMIAVTPETVGQHTGRVDRNNVKIFEGDIVSYKEETGTIFFDDGEFVLNFGIWSVSIRDFDDNELEVIGNIHDNPELMEV